MKMNETIKRISIIGGSGSGKSTLAKSLGNKFKLPVIHIDGMNYYENWKQKDKVQRDELLLDKIQGEKWVMDGTYTSTLNERLMASDLIVFLDYSTVSLLYGVISRRIRLNGKEREEIKGCKERITFNFLKFVLTWRKKKRKKVLEKLKLYEEKVIIFKTRKSLNNWYSKEFNDTIVI